MEGSHDEIAFIDPAGREVVRVSGMRMAASYELCDVSRSDQTLFPRGTCFSEAVGLPPGEVYVSPVIGYYLSPGVAQAGLQEPDGLGYDGIVRWALAVYEAGCSRVW